MLPEKVNNYYNMKVTRENIDDLNAVIKIFIEKSDYEEKVDKTLNDYRKKAQIPGFRTGRAPMGLIKRRFEKPTVVEEVNKMLVQNLNGYFTDEKLRILGEPLSSDEHQKSIDWENDENFEFAFDIGLSPEVDVQLDEDFKLDFYTITVSDEMVNERVEEITSQLGDFAEMETVSEKSLIRGDFVELDEDGNPKEDGIRAEEILVSLEMIRDEEIKKLFLGKQKTDSVIFDPVAAYQNRHEVGHLLKITHEEADQLNSNFQFTIYEISELQNAELNEELYQKVYGEETEIKTEEDFRNQLKEEIAESLLSSSEARFATDVREALLEKINPQLPEAFLKRWLQKTNKELDEEQIDQEFDGFLKDLRWQLIKEAIITDNELEVEKEEVLELARQVILAQYSYYGIYNLTEEQLDSFVKSMMNKPEDMERLYMQVLEKKVINLVRSKVTIENKEVSSEEFEKSLK